MKSHSFPMRARGFSLLELLVSTAIFVILSSIIVANYPEAAKRLTLTSVTQNVSLLLREAQVRGSAIDSANSTLGGYGIYAELANPDRIILFGDTVDLLMPRPYGISIGNGLFENGSPINETNTIVSFPEGFEISKICSGNGFPFTCNDNNTPAIDSLTISFTRPNPGPAININNVTGNTFLGACIELVSQNAPAAGHVRNVQVFVSGMIRNSLGPCD